MSHNMYALQVSKAYSKTWSFREDALLEVYKQMNELTSSDEARNMLRASVFLIARAIKDQVFAVSHLVHVAQCLSLIVHRSPIEKICSFDVHLNY